MYEVYACMAMWVSRLRLVVRDNSMIMGHGWSGLTSALLGSSRVKPCVRALGGQGVRVGFGYVFICV